jgi:IclR family acetate operon transcriptional repressor
VGSVDRALRLLALLGASEDPLSVSEAAAGLGVARSTAHRLLSALCHRGFAAQDPITRRYGPGRTLVTVGLSTAARLHVRRVAKAEIARLAAVAGETVYLVTLDGPRSLVLDSVESPDALAVRQRTGRMMLPHTTASGKALLCRLSPDAVRELLGPDPLPAPTSRSFGTHAALARELGRVRRQGFALNDQENETGVYGVGVAVDAPGEASALAVVAPRARVTRARLPEIVAATRATAGRIAAALRTP